MTLSSSGRILCLQKPHIYIQEKIATEKPTTVAYLDRSHGALHAAGGGGGGVGCGRAVRTCLNGGFAAFGVMYINRLWMVLPYMYVRSMG